MRAGSRAGSGVGHWEEQGWGRAGQGRSRVG